MPKPVDVHVGERVRMTREFRGLAGEELARALGVSSAQLDRYERGVERFSSVHLVLAARRLDVKPSFFFNGLPGREVAPEVDPTPRGHVVAAGANDNLKRATATEGEADSGHAQAMSRL